MSQISPPIRIVLVAAIAFIGVYMMFMRPKEEVIPPAEPAPNTQTSEPAVSEPGKVAEAAQNAVDATNESIAKQESVDGVDAGETAATTKTQTQSKAAQKQAEAAAALQGVDLEGLPKPVAKAIRKQKVLVLLFWNGKSADDKAVHAALSKVDRWDGRVYVGSASIKKISKYGQIARGVDVEQSPTIVVADPKLRAETLVGYVDALTIDQAVVDAFRNSTGLFTSAYLATIDRMCTRVSNDLFATPNPSNAREAGPFMQKASVRYGTFADDFKSVKAPKRFRGFKSATAADSAEIAAVYTDWAAYLGSKPTLPRLAASFDRFQPRLKVVGKRFDKRMEDKHVLGCTTA